ncbi:hypothetical protein [Pantoea ananatis]
MDATVDEVIREMIVKMCHHCLNENTPP